MTTNLSINETHDPALRSWVASDDMNDLMAQSSTQRLALRARISEGLREGSVRQGEWQKALLAQSALEMALPCHIGDYTDFYTSVHHATTVGKQFRPDAPLLPNYKWVPIGYHGRASSLGVSGQRAMCRPGNISHWGRFCPKTSPPPSRRGW